MAQGTLTLFEEFSLNIANGIHDMDTDAFKVMLVTESISVILASASLPDSTSWTETNPAAGYTAGGEALTTTYTEADGTATFQVTSGATTWTQNGSGFTDVKTAIVYNTAAVSSDAIAFIDMTADAGTTAVSQQAGNVSITWNPVIFTLS